MAASDRRGMEAPAGESCRVLYVQYTNPAAYPPLHHSAILLAEAGCEIRLLGIAILGDVLTFPTHPRIDVELMALSPRGWRQKAHYVRFAMWTLREARRFRPTWLYVSDPLAAPAAMLIRLATGARMVYHEHDAPTDEKTTRRSMFMRVVLSCRRRVASRADVCVTPNDERSSRLAEETGRREVRTIWNTPLRREVQAPRAPSSGAGLQVLYQGSIVPARVPLTLIDALMRLPSTVTLTIVGYDTDAGRYLARIVAHAQTLGVADRVRVVGAMPRRLLLNFSTTYDVGLSLMPSRAGDLNEIAMVGASNKPFDYMACGLALLVSDTREWREAYVDGGLAKSCVPESAESIAEALRWFLEHPRERQEMAERGRGRILDVWNYDAGFDALGKVIAAQPAAGARA
jgi:glycosyltransferase involved in cell wall biosynthesis